jgi:hypothetical protein
MRSTVIAGFLLLAACAPAMRWEGTDGREGSGDLAVCREIGQREAERQLPYGNGPPLVGLFGNNMSYAQWKQDIDNTRYYIERDVTSACMHQRGYRQVPVN